MSNKPCQCEVLATGRMIPLAWGRKVHQLRYGPSDTVVPCCTFQWEKTDFYTAMSCLDTCV